MKLTKSLVKKGGKKSLKKSLKIRKSKKSSKKSLKTRKIKGGEGESKFEPKKFEKGDEKGLMEFVDDLEKLKNNYAAKFVADGKSYSANKKNLKQKDPFINIDNENYNWNGEPELKKLLKDLIHDVDSVTIKPLEPETFKIKEDYDINNKDHVYKWYKHLKSFPLKRKNEYGNMINSSDVIKGVKEYDGQGKVSTYNMKTQLVEIIKAEGEKQKNEEDDRDVLDKIGFILKLEEHGDRGGRTGTKKEGVDCYGDDVIPEENFVAIPIGKYMTDIKKDEEGVKDDFASVMENPYREGDKKAYTFYTLPPFPTKEDEEIGVEKSYDGGKKKSRKMRKTRKT